MPQDLYSRERCMPSPELDTSCFHVLDGGFATTLSENLDDPSEVMKHDPLWSSGRVLTDPEGVRAVHRAFLKAGARIIETATYQCSKEMYMKHLEQLEGKEEEAIKMFGWALQCADQAIEEELGPGAAAWVAGSVGPYGACLGDGSEYTGSYVDEMTSEELEQFHFERIKRLAVAGVDLLAVETIPAVKEASAILNVVQDFPGLRCWVAFQCRSDGRHIAHGETIEEAISQLLSHSRGRRHLVAVGVNCVDPAQVTPLLKRANRVNRGEEKLPYVVYPNAGEHWDAEKKCWTGERDDEAILRRVPNWLKLGANIIGGCCRVGPDLLTKIAKKVQQCSFEVHEYRLMRRKSEKELFEEAKKKSFEATKLKTSSEKDREVLPSDIVGADFTATPGILSKEKAEINLKALFRHFGKPYPGDETDKDASVDDYGGQLEEEAGSVEHMSIDE